MRGPVRCKGTRNYRLVNLPCNTEKAAEAADILSQPHQKVVLPNMSAGCSMADMADPDDVYACWDELQAAGAFRRELRDADVLAVSILFGDLAVDARDLTARDGQA